MIGDPRKFVQRQRTGEFFEVLRRIGVPDQFLVAPASDALLAELFLTGEPE